MRGEASMYLSNLVCSRNKDDFLKFNLEYLTYEKEWVETFGKKPFQRLLSTINYSNTHLKYSFRVAKKYTEITIDEYLKKFEVEWNEYALHVISQWFVRFAVNLN